MIVLGIDPGFAKIGYAVARVDSDGSVTPLRMGVIRSKLAKQKGVLASEDNFRRAQEIAAALRDILSEEHEGGEMIGIVCVEAMSFPRSSSVAAKMSLCWGVIATLTLGPNPAIGYARTPTSLSELKVLQFTPKKIKQVVTGNPKAEKEDVQAALDGRFTFEALSGAGIEDVPKSLYEHPYDALGAILSGQASQWTGKLPSLSGKASKARKSK